MITLDPMSTTVALLFGGRSGEHGISCITAGGILAATPHRWFYSGGNGLDGKVSTFRWSDPRHAPAQR